MFRCRATANVRAHFGEAGGITGAVSNSILTQCFASGATVSDKGAAGGLAGRAWTATIRQCFSLVQTASSEGCASGLVGIYNTGTLDTCYAAGPVSGPVTGGLLDYVIGWQPSIYHCYWDIENTGQGAPSPRDTRLEGAFGKGTVEMLCPDTYDGWQINGGGAFDLLEDKTYPFLHGMPPEAHIEAAGETSDNAVSFNIYFSLPIPGFGPTDLVLDCGGTEYVRHSVSPLNQCYPSVWRAVVETTGNTESIWATVNIGGLLVSNTANTTVFSVTIR